MGYDTVRRWTNRPRYRHTGGVHNIKLMMLFVVFGLFVCPMLNAIQYFYNVFVLTGMGPGSTYFSKSNMCGISAITVKCEIPIDVFTGVDVPHVCGTNMVSFDGEIPGLSYTQVFKHDHYLHKDDKGTIKVENDKVDVFVIADNEYSNFKKNKKRFNPVNKVDGLHHFKIQYDGLFHIVIKMKTRSIFGFASLSTFKWSYDIMRNQYCVDKYQEVYHCDPKYNPLLNIKLQSTSKNFFIDFPTDTLEHVWKDVESKNIISYTPYPSYVFGVVIIGCVLICTSINII